MKSLFGILIVCGLFSCRFSKHEWIKIEGIAKDARAGEQAWLNGQNAPQLEPHLVAKNLEDLIQVRLF